ncbi:MAG: hypothetical protein U0325_14365 [Polyangiales bacterium]
MLTEVPGDATARAGIERLLAVPTLRQRAASTLEARYEADGDVGAAGLARMLGVRLEFTAEARDRARLHQRVAELHEVVLDDPQGALDALVSALEEDPAAHAAQQRTPPLGARRCGRARGLGAGQAAADGRVGSERVAVLRDLAGIYDERLVEEIARRRAEPGAACWRTRATTPPWRSSRDAARACVPRPG